MAVAAARRHGGGGGGAAVANGSLMVANGRHWGRSWSLLVADGVANGR